MIRNDCGWKKENACVNPEAFDFSKPCNFKRGISCGHYEGRSFMTKKKPEVHIGYCMKCKEKKEMKDAEIVTMKNNRNAVKGVCTKCGTKMFKILGKGKK